MRKAPSHNKLPLDWAESASTKEVSSGEDSPKTANFSCATLACGFLMIMAF